MDLKEVIKEAVPAKGGWNEPLSSYKITFSSEQAQIEPIYYWLLDFISDMGWKVEKIVDNFMASPGSGQFEDMGRRATRLQEEGMKILGGLNQVIKSVLNLIYDLKEFEIRLEHYDDHESDDPKRKYKGTLSLKQIFLDSVDIKKGQGSINMMAGQAGFVTLRDLFFTVNTVEDLKKQDIVNQQTERILIPRLNEFEKWVRYSGAELRKRMKIEKSYLKSQIETIKLYSSWLKPYLENAEKLRQKGFEGHAALVNAFSTTMFELTLMAKKGSKPSGKFENYQLEKGYQSCLVVNMVYRGHVSQRVTQKGDYGFGVGGVVDITIESYALTDDELKLIEKKREETDVSDTLTFSSDVAAEALETLKEDIEFFLKPETDEAEEKKRKEKEKKAQDTNPFSELFSWIADLFKSKKKETKKEKRTIETKEDIKPDNYIEKVVRAEAAEKAAGAAYTVYDIYKKSHGMASSPEDFENHNPGKFKEPGVPATSMFRKWENV